MLAGHEQGGLGERPGAAGRKIHQLGHVGGDRVEIDPPAILVAGAHQVLHQEGADRGLGHRGGERLIDIGAPRERGRLDLLHGGDVVAEIMAIGGGRDVDHDQMADQIRLGQRQAHRDLAAHAVADHDRRARHFLLDQAAQVARHVVIGHALGPGRRAVVAQVGADHLVAERQLLGDAAPVARRPQQAVQHDHRGPAGALAEKRKIERHRYLLSHGLVSAYRLARAAASPTLPADPPKTKRPK